MIDGLYNEAVNMTLEVLENAKLELKQRKNDNLTLSKHILEQHNQSWRRNYPLDITYDFLSKGKIIEVDVVDNKISKVIIRRKFSDQYDLCAVVSFINQYDKRVFKVKTIWLNDRDDIHRTIDRSKYVLV